MDQIVSTMKVFRKILVLYNMLFFKAQKITYGKRLRIRGTIGVNNKGRVVIGDDFVCTSGNMSNPIGRNIKSYFNIAPNATLTIGNNTGCSSTTFWCSQSISIGDNVKIGALGIITDTDAHSLDPVLRSDLKTDSINAKSAPVVIANNVFIGMSSIICKGVTIGENSIIGAGSVVTKSIPANEIWAGNPAQFVRKL